MRDYSQYSRTTPTKKKDRNGLVVTPSPASSSVASFPNYRHPTTATKSQVAVLNRASGTQLQAVQRQKQQQQQHHNHHHHQKSAKQRADAASISTAATQSSNDNSPRSNISDEQQQQHQQQQQQQQQQHHPQHQAQHHQSSSSSSSSPSPSHRPQHLQHQSQQQPPTRHPLTSPYHQQQHQQQHLHLGPSSQSPRHHHHHHQSQSSPSGSSAAPGGSASVSSPSNSSIPPRDLTSLTPADALSLKRDGPEATIMQLRQALEDARVRDAAEKSNLAKSDATILELRSSVRQLKRQLEKLDGEARQKHTELVTAKQQLIALKQQQQQQQRSSSSSTTTTNHQESSSNNNSNNESQPSSDRQHALAKEERVGELQVQLDRAHAQILTADMVRKELEDTLEAEQYTWELRVQDQERTIQELQQEIGVLADDLEQCRRQWKQADEEWAKKVSELERNLAMMNNSNKNTAKVGGDGVNAASTTGSSSAEVQALQTKLKQLEEERNELQTCLDEALLELEAVDAELGSHTPAEVQQLRQENLRLQDVVQKHQQLQQQQQLQQGDADFDTLEGLQHLYRWLLEHSAEGEEKKSDTMPQTSPELLDCIHHVLEGMPTLNSSNNNNSANNAATANLEAALKAKEAAMSQKVAELESQVSVYKGDLQAREESSAELRSSLKEAVALIKPLQDAVDKADQQKADLQQEIERLRADQETETKEMHHERQAIEASLKAKEQECEQLHHDLHRLQVELEDAKELATARQTLQGLSPTAAAAAAAAAKIRPPTEQPQELTSLSKARADLKAKRAQEQTLRSLLRDAQNRFHTLNQQNQSVEALNQQLQGRLRDVEEQQSVVHHNSTSMDDEAMETEPMAISVAGLETQVAKLQEALKERTGELESMKEKAKNPSPDTLRRLQELESKLSSTEAELKQKIHSEKVLTKNLKEALGLLKPLKNHLEDAEAEKKEMAKEMRTLRRKVTSMEISGMGDVQASPTSNNNNNTSRTDQKAFPKGSGTPGSNTKNNSNDENIRREKEQLEETVRHLEQENSQLHDALDEMSRMNNNITSGIDNHLSPSGGSSDRNHNAAPSSVISSKAEARLNQEIVELKSRYEVTQRRLEDAYVENHTLVEALKEKEESEKDAIEGMRILREKLRKTEMDLENAKYIATSALVKVEQVKNLNHSIDSAFGGESHTVHSLEEKAIELDLLASAGIHQTSRDLATSGNHPLFQGNQHHHPQLQQQQQQGLTISGGHHHHHQQHQQQQQQKIGSATLNGWVGKRSRLADF